jgi:hypothetical protein
MEEEKFEDIWVIKPEKPQEPEVDLKTFAQRIIVQIFGPRQDLSSHSERRIESRRKWEVAEFIEKA